MHDTMMRIVVDTKVLLSGFISKESYPAKVVDNWIRGAFEPVVCSEIIKEYCDVFARDKFLALGSVKERIDFIENILSLEHVILVNPKERICLIEDDPKDNIFIECAVAGDCKLIVSGDQHLLRLKEHNNIAIVSAKEFIEQLQKFN